MLGEDEDWLHDICIEMDPEDGRLIVFGPGEDVTASQTSESIILLNSSRSTKPNPTYSGAIAT